MRSRQPQIWRSVSGSEPDFSSLNPAIYRHLEAMADELSLVVSNLNDHIFFTCDVSFELEHLFNEMRKHFFLLVSSTMDEHLHGAIGMKQLFEIERHLICLI